MKDVQEKLDRIVPDPARMSDWDAVLRDARPRRRSLTLKVALASGALVLAASLFAIAPWKSGERVGVLDKALAAVGEGPVVHVVFRGDWGGTLVDLETGDRRPVYAERELWYDPDRQLVHEISRFGGVVEQEEIYKSKPPAADLTALSTRYRAALVSRKARVAGEADLAGTPVYWITIQRQYVRDAGGRHDWAQEVAISKATYKPVATREVRNGEAVRGTQQRVLSLENVQVTEADFTSIPPAALRMTRMGSSPIQVEDAANVLSRTPYWLGSEVAGLPLVQAERAFSQTGRMEAGSARYGAEDTGVVLFYGSLGDDRTTPASTAVPLWQKPHVALTETTSKDLIVRGAPTGYVPPEGSLLLVAGPSGFLVTHGLYVSIRSQSEAIILQAAKTLRPMS